MSITEKLNLMEQIKARNYAKTLKWQIMQKHHQLFKRGEYEAARLLFKLLRDKVVYLDLDDDSYKAECALESLNIRPFYNRNYTRAKYSI